MEVRIEVDAGVHEVKPGPVPDVYLERILGEGPLVSVEHDHGGLFVEERVAVEVARPGSSESV